MNKQFNHGPWRDEAQSYYEDGHSMRDTLRFLNERYRVSDQALRKFLKSQGIQRSHSETQKLKRFPCVCVNCNQQFLGRTPTVLMCDICVGDDCIGVTKQRLKKYQQFKRFASYGLTEMQYTQIVESQHGKCGICDRVLKNLCVDHSHITGKIRGLLCHRCNLILGQIEKFDAGLWLEKATMWLEIESKK